MADSLKDATLLYRSPWVRHVRMILRLKVLHVGIIGGLCCPLVVASSAGTQNRRRDWALAGATGLCSAVVAWTLGWSARRFVGELRFSPAAGLVKMSTLDVWGRRVDLVRPSHCIERLPPGVFRMGANVPLTFSYDPDVQHILLLRENHVHDENLLRKLLTADSNS